VTWYRGKSRSYIDLLLVAAMVAPLYVYLLQIDAFDAVFDWSRSHEDWEIDELFALAFCLGLIAIVFSWRRLVDLRREMKRRREAEAAAHRLARHDALTGLPNRRSFLEEFPRWTDHLLEDEICALFVVDLDHFKPINDLYGHRLGDEVLRVIAGRLSEIVEADGLVARLAGDEFGILLRCHRGDDAPLRLARRIVHSLPKPIALASLSVEVGVSVGGTIYDSQCDTGGLGRRDGSAVETAMRQADMAMYRAKTEGRGMYRFFDAAMDERLQERVQLEREIKSAIARGEIVPYYQPLVDLNTRKTIGHEILARWKHPTRGLLLPELFIPIAEDTNTIGDLTYSVLSQAVRDDKGQPGETFLSLNLSPRQFADPWLSQKILAILTDAGFPPKRLEIEITETAVVRRLDEAKATLRSLRNLGIRIALDDFGTGYSGLHHLRELSLDTLKIDRSFIMQMLEKPEEAKIVKAILGLGHSLGLHTTAEGIETKEVLDQLISLGCDTGQGFLFGKAEPAAMLHGTASGEIGAAKPEASVSKLRSA
jgi:diguanylate cyclase (GGDEF)-like protein